MAATTVLTFPDNDFKVRWREPYVSEALNRKVSGVIPRGVYRGFELAQHGAPMTVQLLGDVALEHLAVYETQTGYSLTIRRGGGPITISLAAFAGQTVYIAIYATYSTTVNTTAEIRVYPEADYLAAVERPELLVLGKVVVPGAGVIPAADITFTDKTVPGSALDAALAAWSQQVPNSGFEDGQSSSGPFEDRIAGWKYEIVSGTPTLTVTTTTPHSGQRALDVVVTGPNDRVRLGATPFANATLFEAPLTPVRAGQLVSASFWVAGNSIPAFTNAVGGVHLRVQFFDDAGAVLLTHVMSTDTGSHSGTFAYTRLREVFGAPDDCWMKWSLEVRADLAGGPGTYNLDEVLVHLSPDGPKAMDLSDQRDHRSAQTRTNEVLLPNTTAATQQDQINKAVKVRHEGVDSGVPRAGVAAPDGSVVRWVADRLKAWQALEMHSATPGKTVSASVAGVDVGVPRVDLAAEDASNVRFQAEYLRAEEVVEALKKVELSSSDPVLPKIEGTVAPAASSYFLIGSFPYTTVDVKYIRLYTSDEPVGFALRGFVVTANAVYDPNTSLWSMDDPLVDAVQVAIGEGALRVLRKDATVVPWLSDDWDQTNGTVTGESNVTLAPFVQSRIGTHNIAADVSIAADTAPFVAMDDAGAAAHLDHYVPVLFTRNSRITGTDNGAGRVYIAAGDGASSPTTFPGLIVTHNARWRPDLRKWVPDDTNSPASMHIFGSGAMASVHIPNPSALAPPNEWDDSQWVLAPTPGSIAGQHRISGQYQWAFPRLTIKEIPVSNVASAELTLAVAGTLVSSSYFGLPLYADGSLSGDGLPVSAAPNPSLSTGYWPIEIPHESFMLTVEVMLSYLSGAPAVGVTDCFVATRGDTIAGTDRTWSPVVKGTYEATPTFSNVAATNPQVVAIPVNVFVDNSQNEYYLKVQHSNTPANLMQVAGIRVSFIEDGLRST